MSPVRRHIGSAFLIASPLGGIALLTGALWAVSGGRTALGLGLLLSALTAEVAATVALASTRSRGAKPERRPARQPLPFEAFDNVTPIRGPHVRLGPPVRRAGSG